MSGYTQANLAATLAEIDGRLTALERAGANPALSAEHAHDTSVRTWNTAGVWMTGPSATVYVPPSGRVVLIVSATGRNNVANILGTYAQSQSMGVSRSGANVQSVTSVDGSFLATAASPAFNTCTVVQAYRTLNPGLTTFTLHVQGVTVTNGSGTFSDTTYSDMEIIVIPLP